MSPGPDLLLLPSLSCRRSAVMEESRVYFYHLFLLERTEILTQRGTTPPGSEGFLRCHWFTLRTRHACPLALVDWSQIVLPGVNHREISQWDERVQAWRVCSP
ncbi:hypothetical protein F7725_026072, partial [Dissostichus mawsoni]